MNTILHLGLGAFHRAHQAAYLNQLGDSGWSIAAGNLRPDMPEVIEALIAQGGEYTLETTSVDGAFTYERIRSIRRVIPFDPTLATLKETGASPATRIISFTVTESGYGVDAPIFHALQAILKTRMELGGGPVTLLSCDNVRGNGERSRTGLLELLEKEEPSLKRWVEANTTSPNCMVDRITPRMSPDVAERVRAAVGWNDRAPVSAERFMQWVMEDRFCAGRPEWEKAGVEFVPSVTPYEEAKIRILNASHSAIAWAGTLRGHRYIHEALADEAVRRVAHGFVTEEVIPCLSPSPVDLPAYRDVVLARFANPHLRDTVERVAADSAAKLRGFIVPTLLDRLRRGESVRRTAELAALFFLFRSEDGPLEAFCADESLWGPAAGDLRFAAEVAQAVPRLRALLSG